MIQCFVIEPTDLYDVYLRRYYSSPNVRCSFHTSRHDAESLLGRFNKVDLLSYNPSMDEVSIGDYYPHNEIQWPSHCKCGYQFSRLDSWQYHPKQIYRRVDTGELGTLPSFPAGALWRVTWFEDDTTLVGADGQCWSVRTPGGDWLIDSRAGNCTRKDDSVHRCWCRHGEAPFFTVDKNGDTCGAGAGSIVAGDYHGFLQNGKLVSC